MQYTDSTFNFISVHFLIKKNKEVQLEKVMKYSAALEILTQMTTYN